METTTTQKCARKNCPVIITDRTTYANGTCSYKCASIVRRMKTGERERNGGFNLDDPRLAQLVDGGFKLITERSSISKRGKWVGPNDTSIGFCYLPKRDESDRSESGIGLYAPERRAGTTHVSPSVRIEAIYADATDFTPLINAAKSAKSRKVLQAEIEGDTNISTVEATALAHYRTALLEEIEVARARVQVARDLFNAAKEYVNDPRGTKVRAIVETQVAVIAAGATLNELSKELHAVDARTNGSALPAESPVALFVPQDQIEKTGGTSGYSPQRNARQFFLTGDLEKPSVAWN